jgi:hypothetical protein
MGDLPTALPDQAPMLYFVFIPNNNSKLRWFQFHLALPTLGEVIIIFHVLYKKWAISHPQTLPNGLFRGANSAYFSDLQLKPTPAPARVELRVP